MREHLDLVECDGDAPKRVHEHTDGLVCVRTTSGRWVRREAGLDRNAECVRPFHGLEPESDSESPSDSDRGVTPVVLHTTLTGDSVASEGMSRGAALASGDRMAEYGHPKVSFDRIAAFWSAYLSAPEVDPENLTGEDVGHLMMLLKVSRSVTDKKPDTLDDIEGYATCIRMIRGETAIEND